MKSYLSANSWRVLIAKSDCIMLSSSLYIEGKWVCNHHCLAITISCILIFSETASNKVFILWLERNITSYIQVICGCIVKVCYIRWEAWCLSTFSIYYSWIVRGTSYLNTYSYISRTILVYSWTPNDDWSADSNSKMLMICRIKRCKLVNIRFWCCAYQKLIVM